VIPFLRQSNLDLNLQITGSLDNYISFCNQNGVIDTNIQSSYYNENVNILNPANVGYRYATKNNTISISEGDYDHSDYSPEDYF
jgi:hypothetical protein